MASGPIQDRMEAALDACPCCHASQLATSRSEDGLPDGCIFEATFNCGSVVWISNKIEYSARTGCPDALEARLDALRELVELGLEEAR